MPALDEDPPAAPLSSWAQLDDAREVWPDAPVDDDVLARLLVTGCEQLSEFAPALVPGAAVPQRYIEANVLQARELWSAARRDGDLVGFDTYAVRVRPLSATVRQLVRPPGGRPRFGGRPAVGQVVGLLGPW